MTARRTTILAMLASCALIVTPVLSGHGPQLIWNVSASVPIGLYRLEAHDRIEVADLVAVMPPEPLSDLLAKRGYLARNVPLIKRVLAVSGTTVCRIGTTVIAYDIAYGEARERDSLGRTLPVWQGCRQLRDGEVFLMNWKAADSFDSRHFGPLPTSSVFARVVPVWTDAEGNGRFQWHVANPAAEP